MSTIDWRKTVFLVGFGLLLFRHFHSTYLPLLFTDSTNFLIFADFPIFRKFCENRSFSQGLSNLSLSLFFTELTKFLIFFCKFRNFRRCVYRHTYLILQTSSKVSNYLVMKNYGGFELIRNGEIFP